MIIHSIRISLAILIINLIVVGCKSSLNADLSDKKDRDVLNSTGAQQPPADGEVPPSPNGEPGITPSIKVQFLGFASWDRPDPLVGIYLATIHENQTGQIVLEASDLESSAELTCSSSAGVSQITRAAAGWSVAVTPVPDGSKNFSCSITGSAVFLKIDLTILPTRCQELAGDVFYGAGTPSDPYLICSGAHLKHLSVTPSLWSASFQLGSDIDAATVGKPIGQRSYDAPTAAQPFTGSFDGAGYKINNLKLSAGSADGNVTTAMFGYIKDAVIKNITLLQPEIKVAAAHYSGILVGLAANSTIKNIQIQGGVLHPLSESDAGPTFSAPVVGSIEDNVQTDSMVITDIDSTVDLVGINAIGGAIGYVNLDSGSSLTLCRVKSRGTVLQRNNSTVAGAISYIALKQGASAELCDIENFIDVTRSGPGLGHWSGLLGGTLALEGGSTLTGKNLINRGKWYGDVTATGSAGSIGGLWGTVSAKEASVLKLERVGSSGAMTFPGINPGNFRNLAGLIGILTVNASTFEMDRAFFDGKVTINGSGTPNSIAGIVGTLTCSNAGTFTMKEAFSDFEYEGVTPDPTRFASLIANSSGCVPGQSSWIVTTTHYDSDKVATGVNAGGTAYTDVIGAISANSASAMLNSATFSGWNFDTEWIMDSDAQRPRFRDKNQ